MVLVQHLGYYLISVLGQNLRATPKKKKKKKKKNKTLKKI